MRGNRKVLWSHRHTILLALEVESKPCWKRHLARRWPTIAPSFWRIGVQSTECKYYLFAFPFSFCKMMTLLVGNWFHLITKGKKKKKIQLTHSRWSLQVYDASPYVSVFEGIARRIKKRKTHACVQNLHGHSFDGWIFFSRPRFLFNAQRAH